MAKKNKIALESVLRPDENIYWIGKPEKLPYVLSELRYDISELILRIIFDLILIPLLFIKSGIDFNSLTVLLLIVLYILHLKPIVMILSKPAMKALEWKNTYYMITDQSIYIQFGTNHVYYRSYPADRIGTKVFYRKNKIDSTLLVGTIGFSVDDYYEERFVAIKDYEDVYKILKGFASAKREQLQIEMELEKQRQEELLKQQELLRQSEALQRQKEADKDLNSDEYEFESYDNYIQRMQREKIRESEYEKSQEEKQREKEHEDLINKYNEYRRRQDAEAKRRKEEEERDKVASAVSTDDGSTSVTLTYNTSDDSGIEDGAEIEFPVNIPQQQKPKSKKGKAPKKSNRYANNPAKRKPPVEYGGVNGPQPEIKPITNEPIEPPDDDPEDMDMSLLWGSLTKPNSDN